jgi:hypothetical protein
VLRSHRANRARAPLSSMPRLNMPGLKNTLNEMP